MLRIIYMIIYIKYIFQVYARVKLYTLRIFLYKDLCFMFLYIKELKINSYIRNILT